MNHRWGNNAGREWRGGRQPLHSINFITAHDGFPLADLVAYNEKHNEANGEGNRCCRLEACWTRAIFSCFVFLSFARTPSAAAHSQR